MEIPVWPEGLPGLFVGGKSGGIVGFRLALLGPAARLALAAHEVFPQRRLQALFAQVLLGGFRPVRHSG
jgi:hypothetical protein